MSDIFFPKELGMPLDSSNQSQIGGTFAMTRFMAGNTRNRKMFSSVPVTKPHVFNWNSEQAALFEIWFKEATNDGATWFMIRNESPLGIELTEVKFSNPDAPYVGPTKIGPKMWTCSMELQTRRRHLLPPEWLEWPEIIIKMRLFDIITNLLRVKWLTVEHVADMQLLAVSDGGKTTYSLTDGGSYELIDAAVAAVYLDTNGTPELIAPSMYTVSGGRISFSSPLPRFARILWTGTGTTYEK